MNLSIVSHQYARLTCAARICTRSTRHPAYPSAHVHPSSSTTRSIHGDRFRPHYVTTPIFYVNAVPHCGHLYTIVLADSISRWQTLKGDPRASLLTGTDEHGQKVGSAAAKLGMTPKELCDVNSEHFRRLAAKANISYFRFMRTTDDDHKEAVKHCWSELQKRGYIYESKHEGWYCTSDECFYPESKVHLIIDPPTGRKIYASMETGKEVEWTSEINYHFRLSAFKDRLLEHYEQHPNFIVPAQRMSQVKQEVMNGLKDLSVSRPSSRLEWGVRVPGDDSQTIYVWIDALLNYASAVGYGNNTKGNLYELWPPNVQVIGKDIVRFHCIYWPALLMALDIPLPRAFLTHAHWTMGSAKMSKSSGNGVDPFQAIDRYGLDTIRYFLIHDGGIVDDADYDNSLIVDKYKKGLQGGLGNLLTRIIRGKAWNVGKTVQYMSQQKDRAPSASAEVLMSRLTSTAEAANEAMEHQINPRIALHTIMQLVYEGNKYFADTTPWDLSKNPRKAQLLHEVIFHALETTRIACILLQPFIPDKARQALDQLNVAQDKRTFQHATYGADFTYGEGISEKERERQGKNRSPFKKREDDMLFPPLMSEF